MPEPAKPTQRAAAFDFVNSPSATGGVSWFFGIGINVYKEFPRLNNAVKDVKDLMALLQEEYDFEPDHTYTLFDEEATRKKIIEVLYELETKVGKNDKLLLYYSGHGHLAEHNKNGYWIPTNAERSSPAEYIPNYTIREYIKNIEALHTLLISDSCFSGSLFVRGASRSTAALHELAALPSRWAICSGRHDEQVYDGEPGKNSPFAESILDTLRRNQEKELNVFKLVDRVVEQTRSNYDQLPEGSPLHGTGHKGGQYIFRRRADEAEDWQTATAAHTIPAYQGYLANHPDGPHAGEAWSKIALLEEAAAWETAQKKNTIPAYYNYRNTYSAGRYRDQALEAMTKLEEEEFWKQAQRRNSLSEYERYRDQYPNGAYCQEADAAIEAILNRKQTALREAEDREWEVAQSIHTVEGYQAFLRQHPQGFHADAAKSQLVELGKQARELAAKKKREAEEAERVAAEKERAEQQRREAEGQRQKEEEQRKKKAEQRKKIAAVWEQALQKNTVVAYQAFLKAHPESSFSAQAATALEQLRKAAEQPAADQTVADLRHAAPAAATETTSSELLSPDQWAKVKQYALWSAPVFLILALVWWLAGSSETPPPISDPSYTATGIKAEISGLGIDTTDLDVRIDEKKLTLSGEVPTAADTVTLKRLSRLLPTIEDIDLSKVTVAAAPQPVAPSSPKIDIPLTPTGEPYDTAHLGGLIWMTENLQEDVDNSWCYARKPDNCATYGRLYTWRAAKAACEKLGWRMPTDAEWQAMVKAASGVGVDNESAAYRRLIAGGSSAFSAQLGGYRFHKDGSFSNVKWGGHYWVDEYAGNGERVDYKFNRTLGRLLRETGNSMSFGFSCRCVTDEPGAAGGESAD